MALQVSETPGIADEIKKANVPSFSVNGLTGMGFDIEECEPISEREFRMLMAFVVIATFAFGCIVNGWLL